MTNKIDWLRNFSATARSNNNATNDSESGALPATEKTNQGAVHGSMNGSMVDLLGSVNTSLNSSLHSSENGSTSSVVNHSLHDAHEAINELIIANVLAQAAGRTPLSWNNLTSNPQQGKVQTMLQAQATGSVMPIASLSQLQVQAELAVMQGSSEAERDYARAFAREITGLGKAGAVVQPSVVKQAGVVDQIASAVQTGSVVPQASSVVPTGTVSPVGDTNASLQACGYRQDQDATATQTSGMFTSLAGAVEDTTASVSPATAIAPEQVALQQLMQAQLDAWGDANVASVAVASKTEATLVTSTTSATSVIHESQPNELGYDLASLVRQQVLASASVSSGISDFAIAEVFRHQAGLNQPNGMLGQQMQQLVNSVTLKYELDLRHNFWEWFHVVQPNWQSYVTKPLDIPVAILRDQLRNHFRDNYSAGLPEFRLSNEIALQPTQENLKKVITVEMNRSLELLATFNLRFRRPQSLEQLLTNRSFEEALTQQAQLVDNYRRFNSLLDYVSHPEYEMKTRSIYQVLGLGFDIEAAKAEDKQLQLEKQRQETAKIMAERAQAQGLVPRTSQQSSGASDTNGGAVAVNGATSLGGAADFDATMLADGQAVTSTTAGATTTAELLYQSSPYTSKAVAQMLADMRKVFRERNKSQPKATKRKKATSQEVTKSKQVTAPAETAASANSSGNSGTVRNPTDNSTPQARGNEFADAFINLLSQARAGANASNRNSEATSGRASITTVASTASTATQASKPAKRSYLRNRTRFKTNHS